MTKNTKISKVTNMGKGNKTLPGNETEATMTCCPYLPLQHQLFGEQHGLVTEWFSHLHPSGHIPGTAWAFNT